MDLLEIRRKAKEQKKSAPHAEPAAKAGVTPAAPAIAAPVPAMGMEAAPEPAAAKLAAPVGLPPVEVASSPDLSSAFGMASMLPDAEFTPGPAAKPAEPASPPPPKVALEAVVAKAEVARGSGAESGGVEESFLDAGFFQLATEELYRHTYDIDEPEAASHQVLACLLADERYGIDIHSIKEIIKTREITEVPRAPHFILGIITLRGTVIPIFDLRERLGLSSGPLTRDSKIVVVSLNGALFGMVVDAVIDVAGIPETSMESAPSVMVGVEGRFISGIGRADGEMIILLNLTEVLHIETQP